MDAYLRDQSCLLVSYTSPLANEEHFFSSVELIAHFKVEHDFEYQKNAHERYTILGLIALTRNSTPRESRHLSSRVTSAKIELRETH